MPLATDLFDYDLPAHLIAQAPAARRDESRLLVVDRQTRGIAHRQFTDLPEYLRSGDVLMRNNAAVLPARLHARRPTGGQVECFLLRPVEDAVGLLPHRSTSGAKTAPPSSAAWRCLVKPGRRLPVGATFAHPSGAFAGTVEAKEPDGSVVVRFTTAGESIVAVANRLGDVPLPPYIARREEEDPLHETERRQDLERYQTVYADQARQVAVAAPTAGLHFTPELLARLAGQGIRTADLTLHVGLGTFQPISTDTIAAHAIHREVYEIPVATQQLLFSPSGRRVAVGTTSVRSIEDFLGRQSAPQAASWVGEADIFIHPPRRFLGVDALITNFHQPRSTLLCLVAAFLTPDSLDGIDWIKAIYAEAIAREYRFFSYGDAMLIL